VALVKRLIRGVDVETAAAAAKEAMSASTAAAAERGLRRRLLVALADDPILGENGLPSPA
jgi:hypothetical protein